MTHFDFNPKQTTEEELFAKSIELFKKSTFQHGDVVKLKGDVNSPRMVVSDITLSSHDIVYQKMQRKYILVTCKWFNKSRQEFTEMRLNSLCIEKVKSE
jgi:uncharacterized protein YodC (DUF2158 family)